MNAQKHNGGQSNETLEIRIFINWVCPVSPLSIPDIIEKAVLKYLQTHHYALLKIPKLKIQEYSKVMQKKIKKIQVDLSQLTILARG